MPVIVFSDVVVDTFSRGAITSYTFSNITANHTISATFVLNTYTINATAGSNGSISPSGNVNVNSGSNKTFNFTPSSGYRVANVFVDTFNIGAMSSFTFYNVVRSHTISVTFVHN